MKRRALRFLGIAFLWAFATQAQTPSIPADAAALLAKAAASFRDGSAYAAKFTQIYTPSGFATSRRESGQVWIQAPQRLRFEYAAPEKKVFTYDSGEGRFFSPEDKQLTIRKLTAEEIARLPIVFLARPDELTKRYEIQLDAS
ncbi:MAG: outer membrane lipoprotein carrier protein LolA, partial [Acidobacteriota bacterium]